MLLPRPNRPARRGTVLVEFAVVAILLLMLVFGIFEYGRFLMVLHIANNAAREGARFASVRTGDGTAVGSLPNPAANTIVRRVLDKMAGTQNSLDGFNVRVFCCDPSGLYDPATGAARPTPTFNPLGGSSWNDAQFGGRIAVEVTGNYRPVTPGLLFMGNSIPVKITCTMGSEAN